MQPTILVILADGFEEIEAITAVDILRRAKLSVTTASLSDSLLVKGSHGIPVSADVPISMLSPADFNALILPGGLRGVENMLHSDLLSGFIKRMADASAFFGAVCAAPLVLDSCGLLQGHAFTCHPCVHDRLKTPGVSTAPVVADTNIITGRSAGCAMPWALELVRHFLGSVPDALTSGLLLP